MRAGQVGDSEDDLSAVGIGHADHRICEDLKRSFGMRILYDRPGGRVVSSGRDLGLWKLLAGEEDLVALNLPGRSLGLTD